MSPYYNVDLEGIARGAELPNPHNVYEDADVLLAACLEAREMHPELEGEKPPYKALVAVAEMVGVPMEDEESGILGETTYDYTTRVFKDLSPGDI